MTERAPSTESLTVAERRVRVSRDPLAPPTLGQRILYGICRNALVGAIRLFFRLEVVGREKVPTERPFVLAPVHRSYLDFAIVLAVVSRRRRMRYMGKDTLWKGRLGVIWDALGGIPVHRGSADREALRTCISVVENGEPLVLFPEGTRQVGSEVQPLFDGAAYVQSRTGVPVVPVGIGGSGAAMPKGSKLPKPHKIVLVVGDPLEPPATVSGGGAKARRTAIRDQTAALKVEMQRLFDEAQERAGTPN